MFLDQLKSTESDDVEANAEILAEIIKSFAVTFSLEIPEIIDIISSKGGALNMEDIRSMLLEKSG